MAGTLHALNLAHMAEWALWLLWSELAALLAAALARTPRRATKQGAGGGSGVAGAAWGAHTVVVRTGTPTNSPTEYDFVGGDFESRFGGVSPRIAPNRLFSRLRRSVGRDSGWSRAPWDVFFLPKVVVFGVRRGTISSRTRSSPAN